MCNPLANASVPPAATDKMLFKQGRGGGVTGVGQERSWVRFCFRNMLLVGSARTREINWHFHLKFVMDGGRHFLLNRTEGCY